jgi:hypothetical protein
MTLRNDDILASPRMPRHDFHRREILNSRMGYMLRMNFVIYVCHIDCYFLG